MRFYIIKIPLLLFDEEGLFLLTDLWGQTYYK
jgi:hypothetical protein